MPATPFSVGTLPPEPASPLLVEAAPWSPDRPAAHLRPVLLPALKSVGLAVRQAHAAKLDSRVNAPRSTDAGSAALSAAAAKHAQVAPAAPAAPVAQPQPAAPAPVAVAAPAPVAAEAPVAAPATVAAAAPAAALVSRTLTQTPPVVVTTTPVVVKPVLKPTVPTTPVTSTHADDHTWYHGHRRFTATDDPRGNGGSTLLSTPPISVAAPTPTPTPTPIVTLPPPSVGPPCPGGAPAVTTSVTTTVTTSVTTTYTPPAISWPAAPVVPTVTSPVTSSFSGGHLNWYGDASTIHSH